MCYVDTDSFITLVKTEDVYKDIAEDVETRFDTSNYEVDRSLPMGKNKKVIGLIKDELGGQIMKKFVSLRSKTNSYLKDSNDRKLKYEDYKNCLNASEIINVVNYLEKKGIGVLKKIKENS